MSRPRRGTRPPHGDHGDHVCRPGAGAVRTNQPRLLLKPFAVPSSHSQTKAKLSVCSRRHPVDATQLGRHDVQPVPPVPPGRRPPTALPRPRATAGQVPFAVLPASAQQQAGWSSRSARRRRLRHARQMATSGLRSTHASHCSRRPLRSSGIDLATRPVTISGLHQPGALHGHQLDGNCAGKSMSTERLMPSPHLRTGIEADGEGHRKCPRTTVEGPRERASGLATALNASLAEKA
jgi:hypothetical protein